MPNIYKPKKEDIFILRRSVSDPDDAEILTNDRLDWEYILRKSSEMGVIAMLCRSLKVSSALSDIPDKITGRFKYVYISNSLRNLKLLDEFQKIMTVINDRKIRAIPIKGFSLLLDVYADIGMRSMVDLDLLIDIRDKDEIFLILEALGYTLSQTKKVNYYSEHHYVFTPLEKAADFNRRLSPLNAILLVEIHIRFFAWYIEKFSIRIKPGDFIERSKKIIWRNIEIYKMQEIDEFIISLLSYYVSDFLCARYLFDADAILKKAKDFNWQEFLSRIKAYDILTHVSYGIIFCKEYLKTHIPEDVIREISRFSKRAYSIKKIFPVTLRHKNLSRQESRIMRLKEAANFKTKVSMLKEGIIWRLYEKFGIFSNYVKSKSYI